MAQILPFPLRDHYREPVTTLVTCWCVTRRDGIRVMGTELDRDLQVIDDEYGGRYQAQAGITGSDVQSSSDMAVDNLEVSGALNNGNFSIVDLTAIDIEAGLYDNAEVTIFQTNWARPEDGIRIVRLGTLGEITRTSDGAYRSELRGLTQSLSQTIGRTYSVTCDAELGDDRCTVNIEKYRAEGTVTAVSTNRIFKSTLGTLQYPGFYNGGLIKWNTGANAGFSMEVKRESFAVVGDIELYLAMSRDIVVGDTYSLWPGCGKSPGECKGKYNNFVNFRGHGAWVPGMGEVLAIGGQAGVKKPRNTAFFDFAIPGFTPEPAPEPAPPPPTPPPVGTPTVRRYNPGHWITFLGGNDSQATMASRIYSNNVRNNVRGVMKRWTWAELEPTLNNYQLAALRSDLDWAAANQVQYIIFIEDKSFDGTNKMPSYLLPKTFEINTINNARPVIGYTGCRWDAEVLTRWKALITRLATEFNTHANLEGIATQETALGSGWSYSSAGVPGKTYETYTPEKMRDAYISMINHAHTKFTLARVFWHMNFLNFTTPGMSNPAFNGQYLSDVVTATKANNNLVLGGPDCLPGEQSLRQRAFWIYDAHKDDVPIFVQMSPECYHAEKRNASEVIIPGSYFTMTELYNFAVNTPYTAPAGDTAQPLHVNYIMWANAGGVYNLASDGMPIIASHPVFNPEIW